MAEAATSTQAGAAPSPFARISELMRHGDVAFALCVVALLMVLILPMPRWLLDVSLALSITFSDRKSTRLNSSHSQQSRMPSSA